MQRSMPSAPVFISILCSPHGGIATYVLGLLQAQCFHGSSIALAYNSRRADVSFRQGIEGIACLTGKRTISLLTHKLPSLGTLYDLLRLYRFCRLQARSRTVVLIAHGTSSVGLSLILSHLLPRCRLVYVPHGGLSHLYRSPVGFPRLCVSFYDKILAISGASFVCESKYTFDLYQQQASRSVILPVRPSGYAYSLTQDFLSLLDSPATGAPLHETDDRATKPYTIVYLGTWRVIKGLIHLLDVLARMGSEHAVLPCGRPVRFLLYTDQISPSHSPFSEHGPQVCFRPWSSDVPAVLREADAQIIPSRGESFGYAAIEALAFHLPIIHTNVGGLCEILSGTDMPVLPVDFEPCDLYNALIGVSSKSFERLMSGSDPLARIVERSFWNLKSDLFFTE